MPYPKITIIPKKPPTDKQLLNQAWREMMKENAAQDKIIQRQEKALSKMKEIKKMDMTKVKEVIAQKRKVEKENAQAQRKLNMKKRYAVQASVIVFYLTKQKMDDGTEVWVGPTKARVWGEKDELKFNAATKEKEIMKYIEKEKARIYAMFEDSLKKITQLEVQQMYIDEIRDDIFKDMVFKPMYGCSVAMSMPSAGAHYVDYDDMCVPMGLLKHLNDPKKPVEKRIQSMTLETIVDLLNASTMNTVEIAKYNKDIDDLRCNSVSVASRPKGANRVDEYGYLMKLQREKWGMSTEEKATFFQEKLRIGYSPMQVMNVCNDERVRVRMYCLDHRENIILSNAREIPDNKRNKKIPNLVFMTWNQHCYIVEDPEIKESVANTFRARELGARHRSKEDDILEAKKAQQAFAVLNYIPTDFAGFKDTLVYVTCEENVVNTFFYDEIKRGIVHKEKLRVKDQEVLRFEYTPTKTLLMHKPDYHDVRELCEMLNSEIKEGEKAYTIENNNTHSLAMEYYERNYGHTLSFLNTDGEEVMNSPLNSAFNEYWRYPVDDLRCNSLDPKDPKRVDKAQCHQYDFSKHYTSCLLGTELGFSVYSPLDEIQHFDGELREGFYYVETKNYFPMKGNGWYSGEPLREYLADGIIRARDIKYQYLPGKTLTKDHFKTFVDDVFEKFGSVRESHAKNAMNGFIGLLRRTHTKSSVSYFTNNASELCCHYNEALENGGTLSSLPVNYIENEKGEIVGYHIINETSYPLQRSNVPIYRKIYDMSALFLWRLIKSVGGMKYVLGIHTDTVYFEGGHRLEEDGVKFGGIREVCDAPWQYVKLKERVVARDYKYTADIREYTQITDEEIYNVDRGCMVTGRAGTGKSYIIHKLSEFLAGKELKYVVCASTWKAGIKVGGGTIHSLFGIDPVRPRLNIGTCRALIKSGVRHFIIDEISMIQEHLWGILHQMKSIFGFVFYVFGDYNQLPPVCEEEVYDRFELSRLVKYVCDYRQIKLTKVWRIKEGESQFYDELENVLEGKMVDKKLYGNKECEFAIAYHNDVVDKHNMKYMKLNAEKNGKYEVIDGKLQKIYLFEGLKIIANETHNDYVNCEDFVVQCFDKKKVIIKNSRHCLEITREELMKSFKPYYAITVHKAQGDTFDFPFTIYEYRTLHKKGSNFLYTALSRSTSIKHINLVDSCRGDLTGYIYMYTNKKNGKKYIGSTFDEVGRRKQHRESMETDKFHTALRSEEFEYSILRKVDVHDDADLRRREQYFISVYDTVNNGYNSKSI